MSTNTNNAPANRTAVDVTGNGTYKVEVLRDEPRCKHVSITMTFDYAVYDERGWRSKGVLFSGQDGTVGRVAQGKNADTERGRDTWQEALDTLGIRSVGQFVGKAARDAIEPPIRGGTGKPNTSAIRATMEATVDALIKRGRLPVAEREAEIDFLVAEELERRNAIQREKGEAGKAAATAPGALTGVTSGNGGALPN